MDKCCHSATSFMKVEFNIINSHFYRLHKKKITKISKFTVHKICQKIGKFMLYTQAGSIQWKLYQQCFCILEVLKCPLKNFYLPFIPGCKYSDKTKDRTSFGMSHAGKIIKNILRRNFVFFMLLTGRTFFTVGQNFNKQQIVCDGI